jgi:Pyocin activator protein PrtN
LSEPKLPEKIASGEIALPLVRIEISQKAARGVYLVNLAEYLDRRVESRERK